EISAGMMVYDPALSQVHPNGTLRDWRVGTVVAVDMAACTIDVKRLIGAGNAHPAALVPLVHYPTPEQQAALMRIGEWVTDNGLERSDGAYLAGRDLLLRRAPRVGQTPGEPLRHADESALDAARRLILSMERGTLAIQGPPGSGKTYTGARMIAELLRSGRTVGICATSHKVIGHLLLQAVGAAMEEEVDGQPTQRH